MVDKNWIIPLLFLALLLPGKNRAQKAEGRRVDFKGFVHAGYIMEHRNTMGHLVQGHVWGAEVDASFPSYGKYLYEYENNFPSKGVGLFWFSLGNPEQLGHLIAACPYFQIPLSAERKTFKTFLQLGLGVAYATKRFHPIANHKNSLLSAAFNGFVNVKLGYKTSLTKKLGLEYGFSLAHASNGKIKVPNLGVNIASIHLGFVFKHSPRSDKSFSSFNRYIDSSSMRKSKHELYWITSLGFTTVYPVGTKKYFAQSHTFGYYLNVRNTHKWGIGFDIFNNPANRAAALEADSLLIGPQQNVQLGARIGWAYNIGKFSLPVEMGYYLISKWKGDGTFYHRIGLRYYCDNNLVLQIGLKAHWARADYFEYGIGYRFPLRKKQ